MSTNATWRQAKHILELVDQKGTPNEQLQKLFSSGLFADMLDANLDQVDRNEFRRVIGLVPYQLRYYTVGFPGMTHESLRKVYENAEKLYGEEKLAKLPDDLNALPDEFKIGYGYLYHFLGMSHDEDEVNDQVWVVYWDGGKWIKDVRVLDKIWQLRDRVVVLDE